MCPRLKNKPRRTLDSLYLLDAYTDFVLSKQVKNCTPATLDFYRHTANVFLLWCEETQSITTPNQITARHVRQYISELLNKGKKDTTLNAHARAIRCLLRFWFAEKYISQTISFEMPRMEKKRLPVLTADELRQIIQDCNPRDKAIVLFIADSGLRRGEVCRLNWGDVNMLNGLVRVKQGKGKKDRSSVIGATTRRALLKYRRMIYHSDDSPLFLSRTNQRLTGTGLLIIFRRITKRTDIHVTPHALRRTFVILSLRRNMDAGHIQAMLGHSDLTMVYYYAQLEDEDLLRAHKESGPIDDLF